jgi:hypothetical protein
MRGHHGKYFGYFKNFFMDLMENQFNTWNHTSLFMDAKEIQTETSNLINSLRYLTAVQA